MGAVEPSKSVVLVRPTLTMRTRTIVYWHRMRVAFRSPRWWIGTLLLVGFWVLLGLPVYQAGIGRGLLHTALAVAMTFGRAWRWTSPRNMQVVEAAYLERKTLLYRLIKEMQYRVRMSAPEVERFRRDALTLIASYVRGHRADLRGVEIFVNLLVEDGDELVVIARNHDHRLPGVRYPKAGMLAYQAIAPDKRP